LFKEKEREENQSRERKGRGEGATRRLDGCSILGTKGGEELLEIRGPKKGYGVGKEKVRGINTALVPCQKIRFRKGKLFQHLWRKEEEVISFWGGKRGKEGSSIFLSLNTEVSLPALLGKKKNLAARERQQSPQAPGFNRGEKEKGVGFGEETGRGDAPETSAKGTTSPD